MIKKSSVLFFRHSVDTALLQWISQYAVRAYTTADSGLFAASQFWHSFV